MVTIQMGKVYHVGHGTKADDKGWSVPAHKDHVIEYVDPASTNGKATQEQVLFNEVPVEDIDNIFAYARTLPRGAAWESPDVDDEAYADGRIAKRAGERLKALSGQDTPFMMMVGFARPHLPFSVPLKYWNLYDPASLPMPQTNTPPQGAPVFAGKVGGEIAAYEPIVAGQTGKAYPESLTRKLIHGYYAGVSYMDAQLGKVMQALDDTGLSENTIVVLWGDHGYHLGDHGFWTKHTNYEQAARIPLIFRGPGITPQVSTQLSETVDIYPTLAALAGLSRPNGPQAIDGVDLSGVLRGQKPDLRPYSYHCFNRMTRIGQAIRTPRYRLVRWTNEVNGATDYELYDYEVDPLETRNLASAHPDVVAKLEAILNAQPKPVSVQLKAQRNRQAQQPVAAINN